MKQDAFSSLTKKQLLKLVNSFIDATMLRAERSEKLERLWRRIACSFEDALDASDDETRAHLRAQAREWKGLAERLEADV